MTEKKSILKKAGFGLLLAGLLFTSGCTQKKNNEPGSAVLFPPEMVNFEPCGTQAVFTGTGENTWDSKIRERGYIIKDEGIFKMWYTGYNGNGSAQKKLGYATSPDGIHWTRFPENPVFSDYWTEDVQVVKHRGKYFMVAEGENDIAHLLTSENGIEWKQEGNLDIRKTDGKPISKGAYGTPTLWVENNKWYLFYERGDHGIWLATSADMKVWTNVQDDPVIKMGPDAYDAFGMAMNQIIKYKGKYYGYYHGTPDKDWASWNSNVAVSEDLVHWTKYPKNPIVAPDSISNNYSSPILVPGENGFRLFTMHNEVKIFTTPERYLQTEIFPPQSEHAHGATIAELPNGDMLAAWFQGNGERWADDVRIMGARLLKGEKKWGKPFVMADVPEFPDINPVLFIDNRETLWLVWYTVIANQWETSLPKYRVSNNYMQKAGAPEWEWQDVIHFKPGDPTERGIQPDDKFVQSVERQMQTTRKHLSETGASNEQLARFDTFAADIRSKAKGENMIKRGKLFLAGSSSKDTVLGYPYFRRMGWQTKNKPLQLENRIILPFYSDGLEMSIMAITEDYGETWSFSDPLMGVANIQASMAVKTDGTIVAYMRDNGPPPQRHPMSESKDGGITWSNVVDSEVVNPGSGSDIVTLANGNWVIAYNDIEDGRYSLAVSLSDDEGKTWKYTRHIETEANKPEKERSSFAYPSIIQGKDKRIHIIYSYHKHNRTETIKYVCCSEEWIKKCN